MAQSPPSSGGHGPSSSPFTGTEPTLYTPEIARRGPQPPPPPPAPQVAHAFTVVIRGVQYNGLNPQGVNVQFSNELSSRDAGFVSRYLFILKVPHNMEAGTNNDMELYHVQHLMKQFPFFTNCVPLYSNGVHLRFDNLSHASEGKQTLESAGFETKFIDPYGFALAKSQDAAAIQEFEGQIGLLVSLRPTDSFARPFTHADLDWLLDSLEAAMTAFGSVRTFAHLATDDTRMFAFRLEFNSAEAATRAVASLTKDPMWDVGSGGWSWVTVSATEWNGHRSLSSPDRRNSGTDDHGRLMESRYLPVAINTKHPADAHNRVRRERILDGSDVRTTIMLRNIPNKLDFMTLKALLDEVCFGTYDFMYLRIDFKSGNNVGYAFINFSDVNGMIAMLDKIEHRGWRGYRSTKNAEVSYATIQGREALVQKFRNSSVMQETPFCRPRLYLSYQEAETDGQIRATGVELPFPLPDNMSKLQRSMDSARSVGLFPPSGITNYNGQRAINSNYDRGGPRDIVHSASINGVSYGTAPIFGHVSDEHRRECERWFATFMGPSQEGPIPFKHIPLAAVLKFLETNGKIADAGSLPTANPGVIGRPAPKTKAAETVQATTPLYRGRLGRSFYGSGSGGQGEERQATGAGTFSNFAGTGFVLGDHSGSRSGYNLTPTRHSAAAPDNGVTGRRSDPKY